MTTGATGLISGRTRWQRPYEKSLATVAQLHEILAEYPSEPR